MGPNSLKLKPNISNLLQETVPAISPDDVLSIVSERNRDLESGLKLFEESDNKITGKGIRNINKVKEDGALTGDYDVKDRSIYRPIQYTLASFLQSNWEWETRYIVEMSCLHVESCLKTYCHYSGKMMFGNLLNGKEGKTLPSNLWKQLDIVRDRLYNKSKHHIPDYDEHYFSEADAIASYFICRALGIKIMGLTR